MKALIVHDADEVKDLFIGETDEEILQKLRSSEYWEDIVERLVVPEEEAVFEEGDDEEDPYIRSEDQITLDEIHCSLHHDGDSQDGYSLFKCK